MTMYGFSDDSQRIRYLQRQVAFSSILPRLKGLDKAIAMCVFDADDSGLSMERSAFIKISGVSYLRFNNSIERMEMMALKR